MKSQQYQRLRSNLFCFFGPEGAQHSSKMKFFEFYEESVHGALLIFCVKLQHDKSFILTPLIFWGESLALMFLDKNGPKVVF